MHELQYALTTEQPYTYCIFNHNKSVVNRLIPPPQEIISQRIAIYAGSSLGHLNSFTVASRIVGLDLNSKKHLMPTGVIVGTAVLAGFIEVLPDSSFKCHGDIPPDYDPRNDPWLFGCFAYFLSKKRPFCVPVRAKAGRQSFWQMPEKTIQKVQLKELL